MNYGQAFEELQAASLFDLYRLSVAIRNELENPLRTQAIYRAFKEGNEISFFNEKANALETGKVIQKHADRQH